MAAEKSLRPNLNEIYGTLPDWAIVAYIAQGLLKIDNLSLDWEKNVNPVSIDFHLGPKVLVPKTELYRYIDVKVGVQEDWYDRVILTEGGPFLLQPNQFVITETREYIKVPRDIVARLEGKSSLARIGTVVHLTAGRFDPGWEGKPVLELKNNGGIPIIIYEGWPICAFTFEKLMAEPEVGYGEVGRYTDPTRIRSQVNLDNGK